MAIPNKTNLQTLDYSYMGAPYIQVASKSGIDLDGLDYSYCGQPFWGAEVTTTPSGAVRVSPTLGSVKLFNSVGIQPISGRLGL